MSSILKALQKLEKEKSAKEERPVRLAWEVMRPDRTVRGLPIRLILIIICVLGVGIGGMFLFKRVSHEPNTYNAHNAPAKTEKRALKTSVIAAPVVQSKPQSQSDPTPRVQVESQSENSVAVSEHLDGGGENINPAKGLRVSLLDYKGSTDSVAVINDLPVMEGTSIEGYRVVAILPEKVLLEKDGKVFFVAE